MSQSQITPNTILAGPNSAVFYNDNDRNATNWLRSLISSGLVSTGTVDGRSIESLMSEELQPYPRCHFFAGIGGWEEALRISNWKGEPVWTGSCPCQPFSIAGSRKGENDERHLWPAWYRLISECRPPTIFGEQVASKAGRTWLAGVRADLEALGYAVGAVDLPACCVGTPHRRQRLFWVAESEGAARGRTFLWGDQGTNPGGDSPVGTMSSEGGYVACLDRTRKGNRVVWRRCSVEPGSFPLAHGFPNRVARLRGLGNAIVPQVAAEFINSYLASREDRFNG